MPLTGEEANIKAGGARSKSNLIGKNGKHGKRGLGVELTRSLSPNMGLVSGTVKDEN